MLSWACGDHLGNLVVELQARSGRAVLVACLDGPPAPGAALAERPSGTPR